MDSTESTPRRESMLTACFLGFARPYEETLAYMHERHRLISLGLAGNELLLLEHKAVITITRQHMQRSIITSPEQISSDGIDLAVADRGGDATFHGPGQLVGYPLLKLDRVHNGAVDIERYIRTLEQCLLRSLHALGFTETLKVPGFTGIWYREKTDTITLKKVVAIGVGIKDGVTKHGFALNIDIDHQRFSKHIVPCGLKDRGVITLKEIAAHVTIDLPSLPVIMDTISREIAFAMANP